MMLATMKQTVYRRKITNEGGLAENKGDNSCNVDIWKAMAAWELASLKRAQGEQKRILAAVSGKAKIIEDLRTVIFKRIAMKAATPSRELTQLVRVQPSDDALFQAYLREVDMNYARIEDVFRACGLNTMSEGIRNWTVTNPDGSTKELLHVNKRMHPFKFLPTCDMLWCLSSLDHRQLNREKYGAVNDQENTIAIKFQVSKALNTGAIVSMRQRLVLRRYLQANSFVIVWKLFAEGEGLFHGMHSNESGWCRLRPSTSQVGTMMEMHVRRMPIHYRTALCRGSAVDHFDGLMLEITREDQQIVLQGLQRVMLNDRLDCESTSS